MLPVALGLVGTLLADFPASQPYRGVEYARTTRNDPALSMHVVKIDLSNPTIEAAVAPGGPDPDGDGPWQTVLEKTSEIAQREKFDIAINGDFFEAETVRSESTTRPAYREGLAARTRGTAISDGAVLSRAEEARPCVVVTRDRRVWIGDTSNLPENADDVICGNWRIVESGQNVAPADERSDVRHPRTAVGTNRDGTMLILLVIDGRQPDLSVGVTPAELADEMIRLGCTEAINLDGGGSSTLVLRDPTTRELRVMNRPSDGKERPVANVLGIRVRDSKN